MNTRASLKKLKKNDLIDMVLKQSTGVFNKPKTPRYKDAVQNTLDLYRRENKELKNKILGHQDNYVFKHYESLIEKI